jgi:hypothetical protein
MRLRSDDVWIAQGDVLPGVLVLEAQKVPGVSSRDLYASVVAGAMFWSARACISKSSAFLKIPVAEPRASNLFATRYCPAIVVAGIYPFYFPVTSIRGIISLIPSRHSSPVRSSRQNVRYPARRSLPSTSSRSPAMRRTSRSALHGGVTISFHSPARTVTPLERAAATQCPRALRAAAPSEARQLVLSVARRCSSAERPGCRENIRLVTAFSLSL